MKRAVIVGDTPVALWGVEAHERLRRQIAQAGMALDDAGVLDLDAQLDHVVLNAGYLFDLLALRGLAEADDAVLVCPDDGFVAAAVVSGTAGPGVLDAARNAGSPPGGVALLNPNDLAGYDRQLRRSAPPLVRAVTPAVVNELESVLYGNAYKGITDLVTKWWWPSPARVLVGCCARVGITPNQVTLTGLILVLIATWAFWAGHFGLGLLCGWIMTLLDTVDGKLARVTIKSSRIGHWLDHGMDIVHPPFWYVAWGFGLGVSAPLGLELGTWNALIVAGYIGGRVIEALFHQLGHCGMFSWRPFDAWFRLVTARRNPCLIIMTVMLLVGRPDLAFVGVALWTVLSTAIMTLRLIYAATVRMRSGPLDSWLKSPELAAERHPLSWRTFSATRGAYR